ncbi:B12-binding domain-containing protein [Methanomassiliicoccus luminyensis]|uniref:B12-binding domain-containing protein n=1 Tax=Methanomassiliicoccus luminyensis TaxID=1080712 RepID=UPI00037B4837|nr:B12-binding domain-containing protein [Methanomassiliicoccus luminyensis]
MIDLKSVNYDRVLRRYDIQMESRETPEELAGRMVPKDPLLKKIAEDVVFMRYKNIGEDVTAAFKIFSPEEVIEQGLIKGMDVVGELYGRGIYYLPHVMVAADAMDKGVKICESKMTGAREGRGKIVMHVAEGDPHDIGKNIAAVLLKSNGYAVVDMGRDVAVVDVIDTVEREKPNVVTGTALMTTTMSAFPRVAEKLQEKGINIPFVCAGGAVNRAYVESYPLGVYASKAIMGPALANKAMEGWDWRKLRDNWDAITGGAGAK